MIPATVFYFVQKKKLSMYKPVSHKWYKQHEPKLGSLVLLNGDFNNECSYASTKAFTLMLVLVADFLCKKPCAFFVVYLDELLPIPLQAKDVTKIQCLVLVICHWVIHDRIPLIVLHCCKLWELVFCWCKKLHQWEVY